MISTDEPVVQLSVVRLIHGDSSGEGPGFQVEEVESDARAEVEGRIQTAYPGSFVVVDGLIDFRVESFTIQTWVMPTLTERAAAQGLVTKWKSDGGFGLFISTDGRLEMRLGQRGEPDQVLQTDRLRHGQWYFAACSFDAATKVGCLHFNAVDAHGLAPHHATTVQKRLKSGPASASTPVLIGAGQLRPNGLAANLTFDGKLSDPCILSRALSVEEISNPAAGRESLIAAWSFGRDFDSLHVHDTSPNGFHGRAVNMPMKAVTSWNWTGETHRFTEAPHQYAAIHFHNDDLEDARWSPDLDFSIPIGLRSGIYAFRTSAADRNDYVPFFVLPAREVPAASVAYLIPTFTYLAYSNERMLWTDGINYADLTDRQVEPSTIDEYVRRHPEWGPSLYDVHDDSSGVAFASRLRPIPNMRPDYRFWLTGAPRHLGADLYLIDWLEKKGFDYDIVTDEDLHREGFPLLEPYATVVTGSHPEYWTQQMIGAFEQHLHRGGRAMYLGGNGWYWVTSVHPQRPNVIEVRRGQAGSRCWESLPGENYSSSTAELGGLWRHRGKAPNRLVGVGFAAQGSGTTSPGFARLPGSRDPRATFIFDGVVDEVIGEFGLAMGGAAGDEIDRADQRLGSPEHVLILASSAGMHSDFYLLAHEEMLITIKEIGGSGNSDVRADMVFFETHSGGAVFSASSINWMGSLSHHGYDNSVSRITENVLRRFIDPTSFVATPRP